MSDSIISSVVGIVTAIIGLAIIAVVLSKQSQTANVLTTGGSVLDSLISKAVSPISK